MKTIHGPKQKWRFAVKQLPYLNQLWFIQPPVLVVISQELVVSLVSPQASQQPGFTVGVFCRHGLYQHYLCLVSATFQIKLR